MSSFIEHSLTYWGRVDGMPAEDYHAVGGIGASGIKRLRRSAAHFCAPSTRETPAMSAGTMAHCALLEPETFESRYAVLPDMDRRSKEYKALAAQVVGRIPVSQSEASAAHAQAASLRAHPEVARLFANKGVNEVSIFWRDPTSGVYCKGRIDRVVQGKGGVVLFDMKTTTNAGLFAFTKHASDFGYHLQARHYWRGWEEATGEMVLSFVIGAVETEPPYCSATFVYPSPVLDFADREINRALALAARCDETGLWPGYPDHAQELPLPDYLLRAETV